VTHSNCRTDIVTNGYNLGRDWLVGNATQHTFPSPNPLSYAQPTTTITTTTSASISANSTVSASAPASTPTLDSNGATGIVTSVPNGQISGTTSANGYTYLTVATYVSGLLANSSIGINHNDTVTTAGGLPAQDGLVAVLVVTFGNASTSSTSSAKNAAKIDSSPPMSLLAGLAALGASTGLLLLS